MDIIAERLSQINHEIQNVENEKLQDECLLGLFWEHPPALDPEVIGRAMQQIRDRISGLEDRRRALLEEKQALIVEGAIRNRRGNGNNGGN
ncbi:unnamed protein product [Linum tenue]|uniref:Uncharacterized protein n=1 Tax=Linum tenue TaxID=586396 RepID=A0AAV0IU87_9ROSI|nr:unnamed protein product [Linum tenue]